MGDPQSLVVKPQPSELAYDLAAPYYDDWQWQQFWRQYEYPLIRREIERFSALRRKEISILDIGCGTGWYLEALQDLSEIRHGIDISEGMLNIARGRLGHSYLLRADLRSVRIRPNKYDVILTTRVLSHLDDLINIFEQISSAITEGGVLIISDIDPSHNYQFTKLPFLKQSIFAETFKHHPSKINLMLRQFGFVFYKGYSIQMDGTSRKFTHISKMKAMADPAGWIGVWHQFRKNDAQKSRGFKRPGVLPVNKDGSIAGVAFVQP